MPFITREQGGSPTFTTPNLTVRLPDAAIRAMARLLLSIPVTTDVPPVGADDYDADSFLLKAA
jgi:hypothetical protein